MHIFSLSLLKLYFSQRSHLLLFFFFSPSIPVYEDLPIYQTKWSSGEDVTSPPQTVTPSSFNSREMGMDRTDHPVQAHDTGCDDSNYNTTTNSNSINSTGYADGYDDDYVNSSFEDLSKRQTSCYQSLESGRKEEVMFKKKSFFFYYMSLFLHCKIIHFCSSPFVCYFIILSYKLIYVLFADVRMLLYLYTLTSLFILLFSLYFLFFV